MTSGKLAGMKAVSDERGVIGAAAMDQRGSLKKALAKEKGGDVGDTDVEEFKIHVTEVRSPPTTASTPGASGSARSAAQTTSPSSSSSSATRRAPTRRASSSRRRS